MVGNSAQGDAGDDGTQRLRQGFAKVDHDIGDHGDKNGVDPEAVLEAVDQKTSVEELQGEELGSVDHHPGEEVEEASVCELIEGIGGLKALGEGHGDEKWEHHKIEAKSQAKGDIFARSRKAKIAKGLFEDKADDQGGNDEIAQKGGAAPIGESGEASVFGMMEDGGQKCSGFVDKWSDEESEGIPIAGRTVIIGEREDRGGDDQNDDDLAVELLRGSCELVMAALFFISADGPAQLFQNFGK